MREEGNGNIIWSKSSARDTTVVACVHIVHVLCASVCVFMCYVLVYVCSCAMC